jgi:hydrocephalus-inducing protein
VGFLSIVFAAVITFRRAHCSKGPVLKQRKCCVQGIRVPFVIAGTIVDPKVHFSLSCLNFRRVLLGRRSKLTVDLINEEPIPFQFSFDKASYDASNEIVSGRGKPSCLSLEPCSGTVAAKSRKAITATYKPDEEAAINHSVQCRVQQKAVPLAINVKGEGYAVRESLLMDGPKGEEIVLSATVCFWE